MANQIQASGFLFRRYLAIIPLLIIAVAFLSAIRIASAQTSRALDGAGNSAATFDSLENLPTVSVNVTVDVVARQYHAYGDSITAGHTLPDPVTQAYPALVSVDEDVQLTNYAIGSSEACDVPATQIFAHEDSPSLAVHAMYSVLVGSSDVILAGAGAHEQVFIICDKAILSWLAVPAEYKVLATSLAVTTTGPGAIDPSDHWNSWTTAGLGSTVSFPITTTVSGPIYLWPRISDDNPTTYKYSLDGVVAGTGNTQTSPLIATPNGTTTSLGFIRLGTVSRWPTRN